MAKHSAWIRHVAALQEAPPEGLREDTGDTAAPLSEGGPAALEGRLHPWRVLDILAEGGFSGPMSVEIEFDGKEWPPLAEVNRAMRASYDKLASLGLS